MEPWGVIEAAFGSRRRQLTRLHLGSLGGYIIYILCINVIMMVHSMVAILLVLTTQVASTNSRIEALTISRPDTGCDMRISPCSVRGELGTCSRSPSVRALWLGHSRVRLAFEENVRGSVTLHSRLYRVLYEGWWRA